MPQLAPEAASAADLLHQLLEHPDIVEGLDDAGYVVVRLKVSPHLFQQLAEFDADGDQDLERDPSDLEPEPDEEDEGLDEDDDPAERDHRDCPKLGRGGTRRPKLSHGPVIPLPRQDSDGARLRPPLIHGNVIPLPRQEPRDAGR